MIKGRKLQLAELSPHCGAETMEDKAIVSVTLSSPHPSQPSTQIITHRFLQARVQADFSSLMSSWSSSDIWCAVKSICTFYTLKRNHKAKSRLQSSTLPSHQTVSQVMEISVTQTTLPQWVKCSVWCPYQLSLICTPPSTPIPGYPDYTTLYTAQW